MSDDKIELREKLMRRLVWKVPLIIALVSFAVWWQLNHNAVPQPSTEANSRLSARLAGTWTAEVSYGSGERYRERFFFQSEADRLYGTVSFHGAKRGIEDGKIAGSYIWFHASFEEISKGATQRRRHRYEGGLVGDVIHLKLFDDAGNPPFAFSLTKINGVSGASAGRK